MLLESIDNPARPPSALPTSSSTTWPARSATSIVEAVEANSGHLGSNLGVVELTLAMHRVFDSPRDVLLWDTGPPGLRPQDGHRPRRRLRPPAPGRRAVGLPVAGRVRPRLDREQPRLDHPLLRPRAGRGVQAAGRRRPPHRGGDRRRLADRRHGLRGPQQPRPLRQPGRHHPQRQRPQLRADRVEAGREPGAAAAQPQLRAQPGPTRPPAARGARSSGEHLERGVDGALAAVREIFEPPAFFEMLGVRYTGPFDGHDIAGLESALRNAGEFDGPDRRPRAHPEGPRLRPRRERPDQAPARHGRRQAGQLHRRLHRGDHQGGRAPARGGGHHRGHARLDRPAAVQGAVPRPLLRRRHRRAARRHRRRRHGHGRAAAGGRASTRRSSPGPSTRSTSTWPCTASRSCSASTGPASPATTAPATTACSTWCCCRRCRA